MEKHEHTPTPWYCWGGAVYRDPDQDNPTAPIAFMCRDERATAAEIYPVERDANAQFIVRACNAHADLLAALEMLLAEHAEMNADLREIGKGRNVDGAHPDCPADIAACAVARARGDG